MTFKPARTRFDAELEALKRRFRYILHRELTAREELWLELSKPLFSNDDEEQLTPEQLVQPRKTAA